MVSPISLLGDEYVTIKTSSPRALFIFVVNPREDGGKFQNKQPFDRWNQICPKLR